MATACLNIMLNIPHQKSLCTADHCLIHSPWNTTEDAEVVYHYLDCTDILSLYTLSAEHTH